MSFWFGIGVFLAWVSCCLVDVITHFGAFTHSVVWCLFGGWVPVVWWMYPFWVLISDGILQIPGSNSESSQNAGGIYHFLRCPTGTLNL